MSDDTPFTPGPWKWIDYPDGQRRSLSQITAMPTNLDAATLRAKLSEAWWRGRQSANARLGEWAGPELRAQCEKDIADMLADAAAPRPVQCKHGDPACPCQDGDPCHYEDTADTKAMTPPRRGAEGGPR